MATNVQVSMLGGNCCQCAGRVEDLEWGLSDLYLCVLSFDWPWFTSFITTLSLGVLNYLEFCVAFSELLKQNAQRKYWIPRQSVRGMWDLGTSELMAESEVRWLRFSYHSWVEVYIVGNF